jgi:hypothetical protein
MSANDAKLDRLSKLLNAIKSEEYSHFLEELGKLAYAPDIRTEHGETFVEMSTGTERFAYTFPSYAYVDRVLERLRIERDAAHLRHRFLRNRMIYTPKPGQNTKASYDSVVRELRRLQEDIDVLDMYKQTLMQDNASLTNDATIKRDALLSEMKNARKTSDWQAYLANRKSVADANTELVGLAHTDCSFYLTQLPQQKVMTTREPQPKARQNEKMSPEGLKERVKKQMKQKLNLKKK